MSDTLKNPIVGAVPPPAAAPREPQTETSSGDPGMFAKHTPLMPDDPHWAAAAPRPEGSRVAPPPVRPPRGTVNPPVRAHAAGTSTAAGNQGEGDRIAARRYGEAAQQHIAEGRVAPAARAAAASLDGAFADEMAAAEKIGRAPAERSIGDRARGLANSIRHRLELIWRGTRPS